MRHTKEAESQLNKVDSHRWRSIQLFHEASSRNSGVRRNLSAYKRHQDFISNLEGAGNNYSVRIRTIILGLQIPNSLRARLCLRSAEA